MDTMSALDESPRLYAIAKRFITDDQRQRLLDLEARMIQIAKPRYDRAIRQREK
jgi:hypothetical protein